MLNFRELLESNKLESTAMEFYERHVAQGLPEFEVLEQQLNVDQTFLQDNKDFKSFFSKGDRRKDIPEIAQREVEKNIDNTINVVSMSNFEQDHPIMDYLKKELDLKYAYVNYNIQPPGQVVQNHVDRNRSFIYKVVPFDPTVDQCWKYIVFLTKWEPGQVFMLGGSAFTRWQVGTVIRFPWFVHHSTANAGLSNRKILVITGMPNSLA